MTVVFGGWGSERRNRLYLVWTEVIQKEWEPGGAGWSSQGGEGKAARSLQLKEYTSQSTVLLVQQMGTRFF